MRETNIFKILVGKPQRRRPLRRWRYRWNNNDNNNNNNNNNGKWTQSQQFQLPYQQMGLYLKHYT